MTVWPASWIADEGPPPELTAKNAFHYSPPLEGCNAFSDCCQTGHRRHLIGQAHGPPSVGLGKRRDARMYVIRVSESLASGLASAGSRGWRRRKPADSGSGSA